MKKITFIIGLITTTVLFYSILFSTPVYSADGDYIPLAPLPGTYNGTKDAPTTDLGTYVAGAFTFALALAGLLAVIRIVYGGIIYMSTDAISGKSEGKEIVSGAIYGLLLAIASWLIIATINGQLLGTGGGVSILKLNVSPPSNSGSNN